MVSLSTWAANSCGQLSISSHVMTWPVWAAIRPMHVTRLASAPRRASLYGLSWRIASTRSSHSNW